MFTRNQTTEANRWCPLVLLLVGLVVFSSCVSSTLNMTGSTPGNAAYTEIKTIARTIENGGDPETYEMFVEKSTAFINTYPKYRRVDEVYYLLGIALMQLDRIEEGTEVLEKLIKDYPTADYVEPSLLELGLAYDRGGEHEKADRLYEKLVSHTRYRGGRFSEIAEQILQQEWSDRTGELGDASSEISLSSSQFVNSPALDFQVTDLSGEPLSLTQYRGQVVLLDFWATWCPPCIAEMPNVKATYAKYKDQKFEIIGISLDQSASPLETYIASENLTWRHYWDSSGKIGNLYNVRAIPSTFLIDGAGIIRQVDLRGRALEMAVDELVRENMEN